MSNDLALEMDDIYAWAEVSNPEHARRMLREAREKIAVLERTNEYLRRSEASAVETIKAVCARADRAEQQLRQIAELAKLRFNDE